MFDELRDADDASRVADEPIPQPVLLVLKALLLAAVAIAIGVCVSQLVLPGAAEQPASLNRAR